jgi:hypothetical protein
MKQLGILVSFLLGFVCAALFFNSETEKDIQRLEKETSFEHDIRTTEPVAWVLSHYPGSDVAKDICKKDKIATRAGKVIPFCLDPGGKSFQLKGFENDWNPVFEIRTNRYIMDELGRFVLADHENPDFLTYRHKRK